MGDFRASLSSVPCGSTFGRKLAHPPKRFQALLWHRRGGATLQEV